jgi:DNA-binding protein Fis
MIEIKRWDTGAVIHGGDFPSIKECLEDGVKKGITFYRAQLNDAQLNGAQLNDAQLNDAQLNGAQLDGAQLDGAQLDGAQLNDATGSCARLHCFQHGTYKIVIVDDVCHGGCTTKKLAEWLSYSGDDLDDYDKNYLETITKPLIKMVMAARAGK